MSSFADTIFAISSGSMPSGVAVIRISGSSALQVSAQLTGDLPPARTASLRSIRDRNNQILDQGLVIPFPGPHSFTGEDCVELQLHGSRAVVAGVYAELEYLGCRVAEPGEFTRRAFQRGKLDLVEVEGLADLLAAETEMQRRLAIAESSGDRSRLYRSWRNRLLHARAMLEAELDFSDEEDVPGSLAEQIRPDLAALRQEMENHVSRETAGEIIREGFKVVIAGPPNAGKSSLMNALARDDIAIVTDVAGTTRDVLHVDLDMSGYLVRLYDTAGLRDAGDIVERIGIERAQLKIREADLVLALSEMSMGSPIGYDTSFGDVKVITVGTKLDLAPSAQSGGFDLVLSAQTGAGLDELRSRIVSEIEVRTSRLTEAIPSRLRHVNHIKAAISSLRSAESWSNAHVELVAESLRQAADALGRISGRVDTEEILGVIFSSFCIGK